MTSSQTPPPVPAHGPQAIEVAAMLGDSVVAVKHLADPRGGAIRRLTCALLAGGAILLAASVAAFVAGVRHEASNRAALERHLTAGEPAADWRPVRMSPLWDWLAAGGAAGGLALVVLGVARARRERVSPFFRIGRAAGVDHPTDDVGEDAFDLVAPRGDRFVLRIAPGMSIAHVAGAGAGAGQGGAGEIPLAPGARYRVAAGQSAFLVASVPAPRRHPVPAWAGWEGRTAAYLAGSLVAHLAVVALLRTVPADARALQDDPLGGEGRLTLVRMEPREAPVAPDTELGLDGAAGAESGTRMALEEGAMGTEAAVRDAGRFEIERRAATPQISRAEARARARQAGVLGVFEQNPQLFASLTGTADLASGTGELDVYGGLLGSEVAEVAGVWGYGARGVGPGGGGPGWGTVGVSEFGRMGYGIGCGVAVSCAGGLAGGGTGQALTALRKRTPSGPVVTISQASSIGDLDPNTIRRYVRRKLPAIRHCYERELMAKQALAGTVLVQFQISPQGVVQGASAAGMGDREVEGCVADAIRAIQFPRPRGGGMVNVRYPFVFQPAG